VSSKPIVQIEQSLFEKKAMGITMGAYIQFGCDDADMCNATLFGKMNSKTKEIYNKQMVSKAASTAIKIVYYKTATINSIKKASEITVEISKKVKTLLDDFETNAKAVVNALVSPFLVSLQQISLITGSLTNELKNLENYFDALKFNFNGFLVDLLYNVDGYYQKVLNDLSLFENWFTSIDRSIKASISTVTIDQTTANSMKQVEVYLINELIEYFEVVKDQLQSSKQGWREFASIYIKFSKGIPADSHFDSFNMNFDVLLKISSIMSEYIKSTESSTLPLIDDFLIDFELRLKIVVQSMISQ
jgi:hypothetical protein